MAHITKSARSTPTKEATPIKYKTIVADPPWTPVFNSSAGVNYKLKKGTPQKFYPTMGLDAICALTPPAEDDSHLWLWGLSAHLDWAYQVVEEWGFSPLTIVTWCKPGLGVGRFQCNTEHVILARKGSRLNSFGHTSGTWFNWPRGRHSQKPDAFYDLVEKVSPGPYLEMFSRRQRLGWDAWGNEVDSEVQIA